MLCYHHLIHTHSRGSLFWPLIPHYLEALQESQFVIKPVQQLVQYSVQNTFNHYFHSFFSISLFHSMFSLILLRCVKIYNKFYRWKVKMPLLCAHLVIHQVSFHGFLKNQRKLIEIHIFRNLYGDELFKVRLFIKIIQVINYLSFINLFASL